MKDLFTYTEETNCDYYEKGTPMTDQEWEDIQNAWLEEFRK